MNKTINKLLLFAALMGGAAGMTSCDDIVANTDNPTVPDTNKDDDPTKDDPTKQPSTEELIEQAKQLLADAQEEGAVVNAGFTYNGKTYEASFKRDGDSYVLQTTLADGLDASLQVVAGATADDPDNFIFTVVNKTTDETLLQVFIDTAEDTVEVKAADQKIAFSGVTVNGETVVMTPDESSTADNTVYVTGAELDQATLDLSIGKTATLTCTITPANATDKTVTWTSSDEKIATVDANGKVTAVAKGKATITAEPKGQNAHFKIASPTCEVSVSMNAGSISYETKAIEKLVTDEAFTNELTITGDGTVKYASSKESVATVDADGKVTIVGVGETTITATVTDSDTYTYATKTATYTLKVLYVSDTQLPGMDDPEDI